MSEIRINELKIKNYRSFWKWKDWLWQTFVFPQNYDKPISIVWYNNSWKTNLMNSILYWIWEKFITEKTFEKSDLHNLDYNNQIEIIIDLSGSKYQCDSYWDKDSRSYKTEKSITWKYKITSSIFEWELFSKITPPLFWMNKHYNIFYVNFHNIKDEIATQKTSWWNLKSFLGKHIQKLVTEDIDMNNLKPVYESMLKSSTDFILNESKLVKFIEKIKSNYNQNLRDNNIEIDFWLPNYEDIFLQMMFKIWLNGSKTNLVPIDHFWDGYISMFVMAVIQAIAEETDDKCLFLFEEPESFLHENHQEYFYKMVLCSLTKKWHQVIYTTHSDKMIDIFDTKWLIRLELEEYDDNWEKCFQTVKKYNKIDEFNPEIQAKTEDEEIITIDTYNEFIKTIEPNLNRILFSKKVLLVEWPNDILVYKHCIEKNVEEKIQNRSDIFDKKRFAETYLNFHNISIIPHHWKATAIYLIELCKWFWLEYFVINDWDFESADLDIEALKLFSSLEDMKRSWIYTSSDKKWMITTNFNLIKNATEEKIHFNTSKLEKVIWYDFDDKSSIKIHKHISNSAFDYKKQDLFPEKLINFLEIDNIRESIE